MFGFLNISLDLGGYVEAQFLRHGKWNHGSANHLGFLPVDIFKSVRLFENRDNNYLLVRRNSHVLNDIVDEEHNGWTFGR